MKSQGTEGWQGRGVEEVDGQDNNFGRGEASLKRERKRFPDEALLRVPG